MELNKRKALLPEFKSIKDDNEEILWTGKPKFIPFIFTGVWGGLIIVLFTIIWIYTTKEISSANGNNSNTFFFIFGLLPIVIIFFNFLKKLLSFTNTVYSYSDKRVMMRSGFMGTGFKTIDYDKILDIEVTVNIVEKMYNVGTIRFYSGRTHTEEGSTTKLYDSFCAIANPYEVFKLVKQTSVNIKTDYNYPNALRPETNPGYNTRYEPKK